MARSKLGIQALAGMDNARNSSGGDNGDSDEHADTYW
jgi:hypothetical protein